jgi:hypothetical protein
MTINCKNPKCRAYMLAKPGDDTKTCWRCGKDTTVPETPPALVEPRIWVVNQP